VDNVAIAIISATAGLATATLGATVKGYLDRRADTDDELRSVRIKAYPPVWTLTSALSFRPDARLTYSELRALDRELHDWYYGTGSQSGLQESPGGLYLSENARARYGDLRNLINARLKNADAEEAVPGFVYDDLRDASSSFRTSLAEDLETRRKRAFWSALGLHRRHRVQERAAAERLEAAELKPTGSVPALRRAFNEAPAPELADLIGRYEATFAGWLRVGGALAMGLTGMAGWWGKQFRAPAHGEDSLEGENLLRRRGQLVESIPMRAHIGPSRIDGRPALVVKYPADARWPHNRVTDELRPLDDETLLGLSFGLPLAPRDGAPFLLRRRR
jgi:hypothetical protein